jgi:hypothetical protein
LDEFFNDIGVDDIPPGVGTELYEHTGALESFNRLLLCPVNPDGDHGPVTVDYDVFVAQVLVVRPSHGSRWMESKAEIV